MDSWKSRGEKSQRGEEKKWQYQRRKKRQVREKVRKWRFTMFFPRASERRVLLTVGVYYIHLQASSHLLIFSSYIFTSFHLHIFSSYTFSSSHLLIFTSSHLHIFTSSHLLIIFTSSHLLIFTSALSLLPSCPLALFSLLLFYFSLKARGSVKNCGKTAIFKLPAQPGSIVKNWRKIATLKYFVQAFFVLLSSTGKYFVQAL